MSSYRRDNSLSAHVSNLPFDTSEQELIEHFSDVGRVTSVRLPVDKVTGRPLGWGFVNFADAATAASAIRNLDGTNFRGRNINVKTSTAKHGGGPGARARPWDGPPPPHATGAAASASASSSYHHHPASRSYTTGFSDHPKSPPGAASASSPPGASGNVVADVMNRMSHFELWQIMSQFKTLIERDPVSTRQLLMQSPPLAQALLHAQVVLGMMQSRAPGRGPGPTGPTGPTGPGDFGATPYNMPPRDHGRHEPMRDRAAPPGPPPPAQPRMDRRPYDRRPPSPPGRYRHGSAPPAAPFRDHRGPPGPPGRPGPPPAQWYAGAARGPPPPAAAASGGGAGGGAGAGVGAGVGGAPGAGGGAPMADPNKMSAIHNRILAMSDAEFDALCRTLPREQVPGLVQLRQRGRQQAHRR